MNQSVGQEDCGDDKRLRPMGAFISDDAAESDLKSGAVLTTCKRLEIRNLLIKLNRENSICGPHVVLTLQ